MLTLVKLCEVVLTSAVSWGVGRLLDAMITCDNCGQRAPSHLGNCQRNTLGCRNCWQEVIQFTNACDFTVAPDGHVAHVGALFRGGWQWDRDPADKGFFAKNYEGWVFFNAAMRARDMRGKQFVLNATLSDYNSGEQFTSRDVIYNPTYADSRWYDNFSVDLRGYDVPNEQRDSRVMAVDMRIKSRYGDVLAEDRLLANLWK